MFRPSITGDLRPHSNVQRFRSARASVPLLFFLVILLTCARKDPVAEYQRAKQTYRNGDIAKAEFEAREGYQQFRKLSPEWAWKFLILRASALHAESRDDEALQVLSIQSGSPPSTELMIRKLRVQSVANASLQRTEEAERLLEQAEQLCAGSTNAACADVFSVRGRLDMNRGQFAAAQDSFERGLQAARSGGDSFLEADSLLNLSWTADEQTHFDQALDWASEAFRIAKRENYADVSQTALGNMGWAYYKLGDREKARQMFADAERQAAKTGDVTDQISWLTNAGYCEMDDGDFDGARNSFSQSLDLARKNKSREDLVNSLIALAFVSEQTDRLAEAKRYADEAFSMAQQDGNHRDQTYPRLVQGRVAAREHEFEAAAAAFHEVAESKDSPVFLRWEAQHSLAQLFEEKHQSQQADAEYRTALTTFEAARSELQHENSRLPFLANASGIYDDYLRFLVNQGRIAEALQVADYGRARTLREGLGLLEKTTAFHPDPIDARQIALHAGGAVLFYWLGPTQSYLWVATPEKLSLFALPSAAKVDALVRRYHKVLLGPLDPLDDVNNDGASLYRTLIAPAQSLLPKGSKVFVIPDGTLNTLNFETLVAPDPAPHYWIEDANIADASSVRMLAASGRGETQDRSLLMLGDAVSSSADYPELGKAPDEMKSIEKHFASTRRRVFAREQATPAAYLESRPAQFFYIHFVAHGTASRVSPLDSAIVLSGNGADDSFKLYARDIIHRPLRADLVTISTCYGAGSRAYSGEGLVGLSWAFLRAGAHNVIGALWEVSDVSTPGLMDEVYGELMKGKSPASALRAAKLSMLHSQGSFRRPFYWAPFQLYTGS